MAPDPFDRIFGTRRGSRLSDATLGLSQRALNRVSYMAFGDTCFLCEVGSGRVRSGGQRSFRPDGIGTCADCYVHACPQHGDRHNERFRCADCLGRMGAAIIASGGPEPIGGGGRSGESDGLEASAFGARRLLAANVGYVTVGNVERLHRGIAREGWTLIGRLETEVAELPAVTLWTALGLPVPPRADYSPEERLAFDPRDPRRLVLGRLSMFEEAAMELTALPGRAEEMDWEELTTFVTLPIVARGGAIGNSVLRIPGGLTLPPIIAVLAQACADANLD